MGKIKQALAVLFSGRTTLNELKLKALEENLQDIEYVHSPDFLKGSKGEIKEFLKTEPPDLHTVVAWLDAFLERALRNSNGGRINFLFDNRYDIASLAKSDYEDWTNYLQGLDIQYTVAANLVIKREVNLLQSEIMKEYTDPKNLLFYTPGDGTVH